MRNQINNNPAVSVTPEWQTLFEQYKNVHLASRNYSPSTRREYCSDIRQLLMFLSSNDIEAPQDVSITVLTQFLAHLDTLGLTGLSRRRKTSSVKSFFTFLELNGSITNNIARNLVAPRRETHTPRVLTESEYKNLQLAVSGNLRDTAIVELFLQCGIRLSELVNLKITDVQLPNKITEDADSAGLLFIRQGKGSKDRLLSLNYKVSRALRNWLKVKPNHGSDALFISKFRKPITAGGIQWLLGEYFKKAGIAEAHTHTLRHSFATIHYKRGTSLKTIQTMLGHNNLATTSIYISMVRSQMNEELQQHAL